MRPSCEESLQDTAIHTPGYHAEGHIAGMGVMTIQVGAIESESNRFQQTTRWNRNQVFEACCGRNASMAPQHRSHQGWPISGNLQDHQKRRYRHGCLLRHRFRYLRRQPSITPPYKVGDPHELKPASIQRFIHTTGREPIAASSTPGRESTGPTIAKEPVMTIHSRTGTESNRIQRSFNP